MATYIGLAVLNGLLIGLSRSLNGRLAMARGALGASFWNHLVGFGLLAVIAALGGGQELAGAVEAPVEAWLGGVLGALFVAANSFVLARLGTVRTVLLVISGQMLSGVAIDYLARGMTLAPLQLAGIAAILLGVVVARLPMPSSARQRQPG
ncbi:DMT family transporter [Aminobacter sp. HY435]|uniref:DMT family transporter n=1 Tax=Aminobacter sp. HY435 TaxID=2970917 RepID=UPI0022B95844|nr:DMT family transporter [Aminobacter sp. HY435]